MKTHEQARLTLRVHTLERENKELERENKQLEKHLTAMTNLVKDIINNKIKIDDAVLDSLAAANILLNELYDRPVK